MGQARDWLAPPLVAGRAAGEWAYSLAAALAIQRPRFLQALTNSERALTHLTGRCEWTFVLESTGLLALWCADLPASEWHHDCHPFGLLEHSADVAAHVARDLDHRWSAGRGGWTLSALERALWARVGTFAALLHDAGKMLDVVVTAPRGGLRWDPLREPLALFKRRCSLAFGDPSPYRYREGRGLWGHVTNGPAVARALLSDATGDGLGPFVLRTLAACAERHRAADPALPVPLGYLAIRVHEADVEVSRSGGR